MHLDTSSQDFLILSMVLACLLTLPQHTTRSTKVLRSVFSEDLQRTVCILTRPLGRWICSCTTYHHRTCYVLQSINFHHQNVQTELAFHGMLLTRLNREYLEEMRDDTKISLFPKLRPWWLLIVFHNNFHLELHLLVELSRAIAEGELCLQK